MTPTEIGVALFVALVAAWFAWALRRVRTNDLHTIQVQMTALCKKLDEVKQLNREDHEKFFDRIGVLRSDVDVLKAGNP